MADRCAEKRRTDHPQCTSYVPKHGELHGLAAWAHQIEGTTQTEGVSKWGDEEDLCTLRERK